MAERGYVGRFAPTPSGPLHLGSLLTAVASYIDARSHAGAWRLRVDDIDTPRVVPGAESQILRTLEVHGLGWDGAVVHQSENVGEYASKLADLRKSGLVFFCNCTRRSLDRSAAYPGTCREQRLPAPDTSTRVRVDDTTWSFTDLIVGEYSERLPDTVGDFIVRRRDGIASYQLAVVVDDDLLGVSHVLRGSDLLDNTARQLYLMAALGLRAPSYLHVPVVVDARDIKLSKHDKASMIDDHFPTRNLATVLQLLAQPLPESGIESSAPDEVLSWAIAHWDRNAIPTTLSIPGFFSI